MRAEHCGTRVVRLRTGLVLGVEGGMLSRLLTPIRIRAGRADRPRPAVDVVDRARRPGAADRPHHRHAALAGPVNATAPLPVTNADFTRELGRALHRPTVLPVPGALLHRLAGDFADELLLGGQRVLPDKAQASGFKFRHPTLRRALSAMLGPMAGLRGAARARPGRALFRPPRPRAVAVGQHGGAGRPPPAVGHTLPALICSRDERTGRSSISRRHLVRSAACLLAVGPAASARAENEVDLELVLAVDASGSVDQYRFELQKQGYAAAFRNPRVLAAIRSGLSQAIAVTMMQWTGRGCRFMSSRGW